MGFIWVIKCHQLFTSKNAKSWSSAALEISFFAKEKMNRSDFLAVEIWIFFLARIVTDSRS